MQTVYVIDSIRTPIGKYGGVLSTIRPDDLLNATSRGLSESRPFLSGLAKIEERMSGMVDVQKLLACVEGVLN